MFWLLVSAIGAVTLMLLAGSRDGMDYRAREIRAAAARRDAAAAADMRHIRWARRRQDLLSAARWTRATATVARA